MVERIIHHMLQGKILLEVEVSMPPEIMIRYKLSFILPFVVCSYIRCLTFKFNTNCFPHRSDAMEAAKEAEEEILNAASNIAHVNVHLRLGRPIPQFKYIL